MARDAKGKSELLNHYNHLLAPQRLPPVTQWNAVKCDARSESRCEMVTSRSSLIFKAVAGPTASRKEILLYGPRHQYCGQATLTSSCLINESRLCPPTDWHTNYCHSAERVALMRRNQS